MALTKTTLIVLLAAAALAGSHAQVVAPEVTVVQAGAALPQAGAAVAQVDFSEARPIVSVTAEPPCTTVLEVRGACLPSNGCSRARLAPTPVKAVLRTRARPPPRVWASEHAPRGSGRALPACRPLKQPWLCLAMRSSRRRLTLSLRPQALAHLRLTTLVSMANKTGLLEELTAVSARCRLAREQVLRAFGLR